MLGLFDTRTGLRHERKTDIIEWERQSEGCRRSAREARAESFARVFAAVGRATKAIFVGLTAVARRYRRRRLRQATIHDLSALDDRILSDIGLTRNSIPAMATKLVDAKPETHIPAQSNVDRVHQETRRWAKTAHERPKSRARQRAA